MNIPKTEDRDYELWLLFARAHYWIKRARTNELRQYALSPEQAGVLFFIHSSNNNAMPAEIARWMLREPQTITSIIDRMVKKGLVKKNRDSQRRNVIRLSLTEKGEKAYELSIRREAFHKVMSELTEGKRQILHEILLDLLKVAKQGVEGVPEAKDIY